MLKFLRRPKLPADTEIAGCGRVVKPLCTSTDVELYEASDGRRRFLVALYEGDRGSVLHGEWSELADRSGPGETNIACRAYPDGLYLGNPMGLGKFKGSVDDVVRRIANIAFKDRSEAPLLSPFACWVTSDGEPVMPIRSREGAADPVRDFAGILYWSLGGIDLGKCEVAPSLQAFMTAPMSQADHLRQFATGGITPEEALAALSEKREVTPARQERTGLAAVAGMHELKQRLIVDVVDVFRSPDLYDRYGLSVPNGILLYGPPGCGKTYIAKKLAEELDAHFVELSPGGTGSPYIHESSIIVRRTFEEAKKKAPAVVFIDELDALVPRRSDLGGHQQYKSEEVNEFLLQLNDSGDNRVLVIAATNEPDKIDPAILRTGRMDRIIYVGPPDDEARKEMLAFHLAGRPAEDIDLAEVVGLTEGLTASDLRFLVNEAAREALSLRAPITNDILLFAAMKVASERPRK
jgi:AAA+ superfamily predicted ATPase